MPDILESLKGKLLKKHVVQDGETLSDIALKYYGHATEPYWKLIYAFNRKTIGENPNVIKAGQELTIPNLPDELK